MTNITPKEFYFNSQPHKEADKINQSEKTGKKYFNSQPHKEADVATMTGVSRSTLFQLTASQGG